MAKYVLMVLENKHDQQVRKVLELVNLKYGRSLLEKVEECFQDWIEFKEEV